MIADMMKPYLLYICINDGSDMRITKEIRTISKKYSIIFLGIGQKSKISFSLPQCKEVYLLDGSHKSPITLLKLIINLISLLFKYPFQHVHVVDEQLYIFLLPFLLRQKVTLDIFDSMFLKLNKPNEKLYWIKKIIYSSVESIIVTDEYRADLLPHFAKNKTTIIPNVPFKHSYGTKIAEKDILRICYFGTLNRLRGSEFVNKLLTFNSNIRVIAAGWISDTYTKTLMDHPNVSYLGVLKQEEINNILSTSGDYLLAIYPHNNLNNIYASPNKIYDSIHTRTPIIINNEIKVSEFVKKYNIGYVLMPYDELDYSVLGKTLFNNKDNYKFSDELISDFCWENYEVKLLRLYDTVATK